MALYVYAITGEKHPLDLDGLSGVGSEPSPVRVVAAGPLCAVVSDISEEIRPKRRDVLIHQDVQERLMSGGPVLPLQFGYTATDESAVEQALRKDADGYLATLERLRGCAEYHVRAVQDEEELLRQILRDSPEARELNERIRSGDEDPQLPLALGQLIAAQVQERQQALSSGLVDALVPFARDYTVRQASGTDLLNLSLLVADDRREEFRTAEGNLAREIGDGIEFRLSGPLPPYSFVQ
ncbi:MULTISPECIES: GvpL/GvpF family gas vesicle protein [Streptomyces]|uniref:Gas vesicle synthesis protein n=1 Tax=Streptomyces venezuelae (strain ATCC 10712 / CBS 650.69 / DSM 40230 / JCM 4526 / NBRC 13096 / PD 04745) TaxID=953739 RepID=F2RJ13_STRVP|nr:GvpL/GvpF family gas vesicle protein [Streptomyces venezuelae]APE25515.1 gas vesicle protein [Streptomyces venezuelae]QES02853.1 gas vesicle protein [Streptomyces venezuelae ATCC 10712]CCA60139.1 gas vesicle synthesis protein [Streptomyces venezuelae ATCC 10712]